MKVLNLVSLTALAAFFVAWLYKKLEYENYLSKEYAKDLGECTKLIALTKSETLDDQINETITKFNAEVVNKFNRFKKDLKRKYVEEFADCQVSDDEEDYEDDDALFKVRIEKVREILAAPSQDVRFNEIITNSVPRVHPQTSWIRKLQPQASKMLMKLLIKRAKTHCSAIQQNIKQFKLAARDAPDDKKEGNTVAEILKQYIEFESLQVIHYGKCCDKLKGNSVWQTAMQSLYADEI